MLTINQMSIRTAMCWLPRFISAAVVIAVASIAPVAHAQASADESGIRAAMILNIARFIEWPAWKMNADHPQFVICILGSDPIDGYAGKLLEHQNVGSKPTLVKHLNSTDSVSSCHVLYASVADRRVLSKLQAELVKGAVLSVSERSNNVAQDQVVGLPAVEDRIRIEINLSLAQRCNLQISSRLLHLATVTP